MFGGVRDGVGDGGLLWSGRGNIVGRPFFHIRVSKGRNRILLGSVGCGVEKCGLSGGGYLIVGGTVELDVGGVESDLEEIYWAMRSDSSRKAISSSYAPTMEPASGSHLQSASLSTADGVKHLVAWSP